MSRTSPEVLQTVRQLASAGKSSKEIGLVVGKTAKAIQKLFVRHKIPCLPQGGQRGQVNHFWKRGWTVDRDGYILVLYSDHPFANSGGYVRAHRLVMESKVGRWLLPGEVVDHIDGNKQNNDPTNLRLFSRNSEHLRVTLKGKTPKWSKDGILRIRAGLQRSLSGRGLSIQIEFGSDAAQ